MKYFMNTAIYLDYAATTPVDPLVAEKMAHFLTREGGFGNPSSAHPFGLAAKKAIDLARSEVADLIHADPEEIIWTSGATEANNLALKGAAKLYQNKGKHLVTVKTEHPAVLDCCQWLEKEGFFITYLTPEKNGVLSRQSLLDALRDETILVSIMHVNNEIGVIQNIEEIAQITASQGVLFHTDAAQSAGKIPLDVRHIPVDLVSFSAHKMYGPKGIGALYVRRKPRVKLAAQIHGGGQEQGMRSGTLATHQIVGMGEACRLAKKTMEHDEKKIRDYRDLFWQGIKHIKNISVNGDLQHTFPGILNVCFPGILTEKLMNQLPELALSAGSACHSKGIEPSYVLRALGLSTQEANCSVRFSFGRFTTRKEIDFAIEKIGFLFR
jgi:cysteine desulfurase